MAGTRLPPGHTKAVYPPADPALTPFNYNITEPSSRKGTEEERRQCTWRTWLSAAHTRSYDPSHCLQSRLGPELRRTGRDNSLQGLRS